MAARALGRFIQSLQGNFAIAALIEIPIPDAT